jgi:glycosyltransferase involved in cell wall biosynthesis
MRILFVLPGPFNSNNGYHVQLYARMLERCGVQCIVAIPDPWFTGEENGGYSFSSLQADDTLRPDLIHAWTPREIVRKLSEEIATRHSCPIIVHLEDNEEYLTEVTVGRSCAELRKLPMDEVDRLIPEDRYHPVRGCRFLDGADGVTLLIDTLKSFIGSDQPNMTIAPPVDEQLFFPRPLNVKLRHETGISNASIVFAYTGNVHAGNKDEVRELYRAIELLNERGYPSVLLRTGGNASGLGIEDWNQCYEKHLGWVERQRVPEILAAADILIQPGEAGPFNDFRIPCKLPEYFAMGRPVILPKTNVGLKVCHGKEGYVLERADAVNIVAAVTDIMGNEALRDRLSSGGVGFYRRTFGEKPLAANLLEFYLQSVNPQI